MAATLNPDEVNALMSAIQEGRIQSGTPDESSYSATGARGPVVPYDLTSQDRIIRGQLPTLDAINEQVASALAIGLSGRTRLTLQSNSIPATLMKFVDFSALLAPPSVVALLELGAGFGMALAVLEPRLSEGLLSAAMGDRKARPSELALSGRRELTAVEQLVLRRLLGMLAEAMRTSWAHVLPLTPSVQRFEPDPRMAMIVPPNEVVIVSNFEIDGVVQGRLQLVIPYSSVESAKAKLSSPPRMTGSGDRRFAESFAAELEQVKVEVCAVLGSTRVRLERLLELEVGDVLTLDTEEGAAVPVLVQGRHKLEGTPLVSAGSHAVQVATPLTEQPELGAAPTLQSPSNATAPSSSPSPGLRSPHGSQLTQP